MSILTGHATVDPRSIHLISDAAHNDLMATGSNETTQHYLNAEIARMAEYDAFVIEVSSLTEFDVMTSNGARWVNTFTARDLERDEKALDRIAAQGYIDIFQSSNIKPNRHDTRSAVAVMGRIKTLLRGRPILWVSHANITERTPTLESVWVARDRLAAVLSLGARTLGDDFYNPTAMVEQLGQSVAFEKAGSDIYHYTPTAIQRLGDLYWDRLSTHGSAST